MEPHGDAAALGANLGLEAITWIPDDVLVAKGFFDESTGAKYNPASYPGHGTGLFFVGVEQDGTIVGYALDAAAARRKVATIASGFLSVHGPRVRARVQAAVGRLRRHLRRPHRDAGRRAATGRFAVTGVYERPAGMANLNNEGFAIAPQAECVEQPQAGVLARRHQHALGNALRVGTIRCTVPTVDPGPSPTPVATASPVATVAPTPVPTTPGRTARPRRSGSRSPSPRRRAPTPCARRGS